nr:MAG TPA: hypothetical protein [Caudoviricetes sp.]
MSEISFIFKSVYIILPESSVSEDSTATIPIRFNKPIISLSVIPSLSVVPPLEPMLIKLLLFLIHNFLVSSTKINSLLGNCC